MDIKRVDVWTQVGREGRTGWEAGTDECALTGLGVLEEGLITI